MEPLKALSPVELYDQIFTLERSLEEGGMRLEAKRSAKKFSKDKRYEAIRAILLWYQQG